MSGKLESTTAKLKCKAARGMFAHEAGILFRGSERNYESMLDSKFVHFDAGGELGDDDASALVDVGVLEINCQNVLVELPRETISGGRRVWVPKSEVGM
jgi:hypothetical protein